ncbi:MAG: hypothetical protein GVY25_04790, partial [Bacteroidetes bacterium]|nr:hypothetical protein [Bacteroidota bacterium]
MLSVVLGGCDWTVCRDGRLNLRQIIDPSCDLLNGPTHSMLYGCRSAPVLAGLIVFAVTLAGCDFSGDDRTLPPPAPPDVFPTDRTPAWSPGGDRIAYHHDAGGTEDTTDVSGLYVLNLDTDSTWLVVEGSARSPDWRPDGERLAFSTGNIYTVRPDGSDLRQVTDHGSAFFPSWSPDGKRLAYDA